jgi:hypothetical protein
MQDDVEHHRSSVFSSPIDQDGWDGGCHNGDALELGIGSFILSLSFCSSQSVIS